MFIQSSLISIYLLPDFDDKATTTPLWACHGALAYFMLKLTKQILPDIHEDPTYQIIKIY